MHTLEWASEITWNMDGGTEFGPYEDEMVSCEWLSLSAGNHLLYVFDAYGDGWHGGYWELQDGCGVQMAGGDRDGLVEGAGGEVGFSLPFASSTCDGAVVVPDDGSCPGR
jgi:hypothetical protein